VYYRRKIILSILQKLNKKVSHIYFQKFNFLFSEKQIEKNFHFVPYKFGCYSFQIESDIRTMIKYGLLEDNKGYKKLFKEDYISQLKKSDEIILRDLYKQFGNKDEEEIIKYVYSNYTYYSLKSEIKDKYLSKDTIRELNKNYNFNSEKLFTLGYEGISIDEYLNKLILNNISVLCDVRKNPFSMKYGFSKKQLKDYCNKLGIEYIHIPELGIESEKRKNLNSDDDYISLFENYKRETLPYKKNFLIKIIELVRNYKRVALTCFELDFKHCHRNKVAEELRTFKSFIYPVEHL
jgi:uncharacterized protein (DUF488 family)